MQNKDGTTSLSEQHKTIKKKKRDSSKNLHSSSIHYHKKIKKNRKKHKDSQETTPSTQSVLSNLEKTRLNIKNIIVEKEPDAYDDDNLLKPGIYPVSFHPSPTIHEDYTIDIDNDNFNQSQLIIDEKNKQTRKNRTITEAIMRRIQHKKIKIHEGNNKERPNRHKVSDGLHRDQEIEVKSTVLNKILLAVENNENEESKISHLFQRKNIDKIRTLDFLLTTEYDDKGCTRLKLFAFLIEDCQDSQTKSYCLADTGERNMGAKPEKKYLKLIKNILMEEEMIMHSEQIDTIFDYIELVVKDQRPKPIDSFNIAKALDRSTGILENEVLCNHFGNKEMAIKKLQNFLILCLCAIKIDCNRLKPFAYCDVTSLFINPQYSTEFIDENIIKRVKNSSEIFLPNIKDNTDLNLRKVYDELKKDKNIIYPEQLEVNSKWWYKFSIIYQKHKKEILFFLFTALLVTIATAILVACPPSVIIPSVAFMKSLLGLEITWKLAAATSVIAFGACMVAYGALRTIYSAGKKIFGYLAELCCCCRHSDDIDPAYQQTEKLKHENEIDTLLPSKSSKTQPSVKNMPQRNDQYTNSDNIDNEPIEEEEYNNTTMETNTSEIIDGLGGKNHTITNNIVIMNDDTDDEIKADSPAVKQKNQENDHYDRESDSDEDNILQHLDNQENNDKTTEAVSEFQQTPN